MKGGLLLVAPGAHAVGDAGQLALEAKEREQRPQVGGVRLRLGFVEWP
jgi:hypothetical protein